MIVEKLNIKPVNLSAFERVKIFNTVIERMPVISKENIREGDLVKMYAYRDSYLYLCITLDRLNRVCRSEYGGAHSKYTDTGLVLIKVAPIRDREKGYISFGRVYVDDYRYDDLTDNWNKSNDFDVIDVYRTDINMNDIRNADDLYSLFEDNGFFEGKEWSDALKKK